MLEFPRCGWWGLQRQTQRARRKYPFSSEKYIIELMNIGLCLKPLALLEFVSVFYISYALRVPCSQSHVFPRLRVSLHFLYCIPSDLHFLCHIFPAIHVPMFPGIIFQGSLPVKSRRIRCYIPWVLYLHSLFPESHLSRLLMFPELHISRMV